MERNAFQNNENKKVLEYAKILNNKKHMLVRLGSK